MGYCFVGIEKVKSFGVMKSKYLHNYREVAVENAAIELEHRNEELVSLNGIDYNQAFKNRINDLPYYANHKIRKDAVLGLEVVTTYSREENIDQEAWKRKNVEWLNRSFNVAPDGKSNVVSVMYHGDEAGNVHCHAFVIPIDKGGRLNAKYFTGGRKVLSELQTDYGNAMKEFGLERGLENGQARHRDIKKYYATLNRALILEEARKSESGIEFYKRFQEELQTIKAQTLKETDDYVRSEERKLARKRIENQELVDNYLENKEQHLDGMLENKKVSLDLVQQEIEKCEKMSEALEREAKVKQRELDRIEYQIMEVSKRNCDFGFLERLEKINPKEYERIIDEVKEGLQEISR